jgi:hypothetical protein
MVQEVFLTSTAKTALKVSEKIAPRLELSNSGDKAGKKVEKDTTN